MKTRLQVIVALALVVFWIGCSNPLHRLFDNPVDPDSDTYIGTPSEDNDGDGIPQYEDLDEIELVSPEDGVTVTVLPLHLVTNRFNPEIAQRYWIQLSTSDSDFTGSIVFSDDNLASNECEISFGTITTDGIYYWRAKAYDGSKWSDDWSEIRSIIVDVDTGVPLSPTPADGSICYDPTPLLNWEDIAGAVQYRVQVNTNNEFAGTSIADVSSLTSSQYQISTTLAFGNTYYWRVIIKNAYGVWSAWSSTWSFTVMPIVVTGVSISPGSSLALMITGTQQLTANIEPPDATNQNVTWSTSNAMVAAIDPSGLVTPQEPGSATLTVTTEDGGFSANCDVSIWQMYSYSSHPQDIATDSIGRIYYTAAASIIRIDDMSGSGVTSFGSAGSGIGQFNNPRGIAIDSFDRIYISDSRNRRVVRIDNMSGEGWTTYGSSGNGVGQFGGQGVGQGPEDVAVDSLGRIYVSDTHNHRIVRFNDMSGTGWIEYGTYGDGVGKFRYPDAIALDQNDRIHISDGWYHHRIVRVDDMSGTGWVTYGSEGTVIGDFDRSSCMAVDSYNRVIVCYDSSVVSYYRFICIDDMSEPVWTALSTPSTMSTYYAMPGMSTGLNGLIYVTRDYTSTDSAQIWCFGIPPK